MTPVNTVTLSCTIVEQPQPGEGRTALVKLEHRQANLSRDCAIQVSTVAVWCRAWGHAAASLLKYGVPGLDILVSGRLGHLPEVDAIGIIADSISYTRPSQLANSEKSGPE